MNKLLRNNSRQHEHLGDYEIWHSFITEDQPGNLKQNFGFLLGFDELRLLPNATTSHHWDYDSEIVTYVFRGALSQEDTMGSSCVINTGEFQHMSTGQWIRHKETSVSQSDRVHLFRMSLQPAQIGLLRTHEEKRFTEAERRGKLCVVVSPDGRKGSLQINQDVLVYSAILDSGRHLIHELKKGRTAWLHVIYGEAVINDQVLTSGDSIGVVDKRAISFTVKDKAEIILLDLGPEHLRPWETKVK